MAAGTANAAKISFSEKGFIDVGALVQAQYRIEQDAAGTGKDPSNDFLLRRARIIISGQFNDNIGFLIDTDVSYGAVGGATAGTTSGAGGNALTGPGPGTTYSTGTGAGFNNNLYLLDAVATYKVGKEFILDAGLMLLPYSHNSLTSGAKYASVNLFPTFFTSNRAFRDVGVLVRGLLLDDRLYYRLGVFNGAQTTPAGPTGINSGDAPKFAGMLRFNIAGKEDGYAFCQVCFSKTPIINVGVSSEFQANAIRGTSYNTQGSPVGTPTGLTSNTIVNGDVFASIPFADGDQELSVDVLFTRVWQGSNTPQSGYGIFGLISYRFGVIGPYFQAEYFKPDAGWVGGNGAATGAVFVNGINRTYRGGINWYVLQHIYKISAEFAWQARQGAGQTINKVQLSDNHWLGTLQFQVGF